MHRGLESVVAGDGYTYMQNILSVYAHGWAEMYHGGQLYRVLLRVALEENLAAMMVP